MPGSGKTHWLKPLADALAFRHLDLDVNIEERSGMRISEIFDRQGEAHFRDLERETLDTVLQRKEEDWVIATGGGTPSFFDNLHKMKTSGLVIYLKKDIPGLAAHLSEDASQRPLLSANEDKTELLQTLLARRKDIYEQADLILDATKLTLPIFVARVKPFLAF